MLNKYLALRKRFTPKKIQCVFVLESPPAGPAYFYNPNGRTTELLFRAFMSLIGYSPKNKTDGLKKFAALGCVVIDPIYIPVNKLPDREADRLIVKNYPNFLKDLKILTKNNPRVPIILIKANILKFLEAKLLKEGFNVMNNGVPVPFPMHYHLKSFMYLIREMLS